MSGRIRLNDKKEASLVTWKIRQARVPNKVRIPLDQLEGPLPRPCVNVGDSVRVGQKIAEPTSLYSVALHASISGKVAAIHGLPHPLGEESPAIEILSDGRDDFSPRVDEERKGWENLAREDILRIFQDSGLVGLGGKMVPVHAKIMQALTRKIHTLIINGCESEPYLTSDHVLMMSHSLEILKGAEILRKLLDAERVILVTLDNKLEPAEILKSKIFSLKWKQYEVRILPALYPQGEEQMLARDIFPKNTKTKMSRHGAGLLVHNVATAYAVYQAVRFQKPLYERVVTVGGECLAEAGNFWVRLGTSFQDVIKNSRGLLREPRKLIMGGPMRGIAQTTLEVPVIKGTQGIFALPKEVSKIEEIKPCIRCIRCVEACPVSISPVMITLAVERGIFSLTDGGGIHQCIECGNCAYVCPSKRPMIELLRVAKSERGITASREIRA